MREQSKKGKRDPIVQNFENLAESVAKYQSKNISKHAQILELNHGFDFKLYHPAVPSYETREQLSTATQLLLQQIDRLMDDE